MFRTLGATCFLTAVPVLVVLLSPVAAVTIDCSDLGGEPAAAWPHPTRLALVAVLCQGDPLPGWWDSLWIVETAPGDAPRIIEVPLHGTGVARFSWLDCPGTAVAYVVDRTAHGNPHRSRASARARRSASGCRQHPAPAGERQRAGARPVSLTILEQEPSAARRHEPGSQCRAARAAARDSLGAGLKRALSRTSAPAAEKRASAGDASARNASGAGTTRVCCGRVLVQLTGGRTSSAGNGSPPSKLARTGMTSWSRPVHPSTQAQGLKYDRTRASGCNGTRTSASRGAGPAAPAARPSARHDTSNWAFSLRSGQRESALSLLGVPSPHTRGTGGVRTRTRASRLASGPVTNSGRGRQRTVMRTDKPAEAPLWEPLDPAVAAERAASAAATNTARACVAAVRQRLAARRYRLVFAYSSKE